MTQVKVITKSVLRRDWGNIEPKLVAGTIAALSSAQVVSLGVGLLTGTHNVLLAEVATVVPTVAFLLVGYFKASTHKGELLRKIENDLPGDLDALAHDATAAHLPVPAAAVVAIDGLTLIDRGSNITPVPATTTTGGGTPATLVLPGDPTPTLPQQ